MGLCSIVKVILKFDRLVLPPLLHGCICSESFIPEFWFRCAQGDFNKDEVMAVVASLPFATDVL